MQEKLEKLSFSISSARKFFLADKIIIFIGRKADVQECLNPPNFTNYKIQSIIVSIQIVGVGMEILESLPLVLLQEAFIGSIWLKNTSLITIRYNRESKVNSEQEACAKCFPVHIIKRSIFQTFEVSN